MNADQASRERLERAQRELAQLIKELHHQLDEDSPRRLARAYFGAREELGLSSYDVEECAAFLERVALQMRKAHIARRIDPPRD